MTMTVSQCLPAVAGLDRRGAVRRAWRSLALMGMLVGLAGSATPAAASVFGADDRHSLDVTQQPWTALGRIELHAADVPPVGARGPFPICTGTLVAADLVLTNAHCVLDLRTGRVTKQVIWFRAGMEGRRATTDAYAVRVWHGTRRPDSQRGLDWALIQLNARLGDQFGWMEVEDDVQPLALHDLAFVAYAQDFRAGLVASMQRNCSVFTFDALRGYYRHDCDMNAGSSGGPLVDLASGTPKIVAINAAHTARQAISWFAQFGIGKANVAVSANRFRRLLRQLRPLDAAPGMTLSHAD